MLEGTRLLLQGRHIRKSTGLPPCLTAACRGVPPHDAPNPGARNRGRVVTDNWRMLGEDMRNAFGGIIGDDPALRQMLGRAALVAPTTTPVLVMGESGTGKELLARALHALGPHPGGPLVAVNCGALPRELAESELFGHERGSFTGAGARRAGWFEEASAGTLVLDEIGELPLDLQPKLLRVLESGRLRRVGGTGEVAVRARIIAMTLRNLEGEVQRRTFRPDLYYRLAGICLRIPPLRERRNDIPQLALHFLNEIAPEVGQRVLEPDAMAALAAADWPGNVRELRNVIRRSAILTRGRADGRITADALELPATGPFRLAESPRRRTRTGGSGAAGPRRRDPSGRPNVRRDRTRGLLVGAAAERRQPPPGSARAGRRALHLLRQGPPLQPLERTQCHCARRRFARGVAAAVDCAGAGGGSGGRAQAAAVPAVASPGRADAPGGGARLAPGGGAGAQPAAGRGRAAAARRRGGGGGAAGSARPAAREAEVVAAVPAAAPERPPPPPRAAEAMGWAAAPAVGDAA